jgi:hypothetical protein
VNRPVFSDQPRRRSRGLRADRARLQEDHAVRLPQSVSNAQRNLTFPQRFVSSMGQAEFEKAGVELGRFLVNSTVGIGGLLDSGDAHGHPRSTTRTSARCWPAWHVPPGPYIVIPVLGPSTARDGLGDLASIALNPLVWAGVSVPPLGVLFAINRRAEADDRIRQAEAAALDYYVFARDAYIQRRTRLHPQRVRDAARGGGDPRPRSSSRRTSTTCRPSRGRRRDTRDRRATPQSSDTPTGDAPPPC